MKISKIPGLGNYGIFIDDLDLANISDEQWLEIGQLHLKNLVTIIRNTNIDWRKQSDLMTLWGENTSGMTYTLLKKYNESSIKDVMYRIMRNDPTIEEDDKAALLEMTNMVERDTMSHRSSVMRVSGQKDAQGRAIGMFAEGDLLWHSNESGTLTFVPGVSLLGSQNVVGSATGFLTTTDYYENVSESFRSELDDMILVHRFTPGKINPGLRKEQDVVMHKNMCPEDDIEIPMVIQSPGGIKGLHYPINTAYLIKGLSKEESDKVFESINKELFVDDYIYDHYYQNENDLLLFDNSITLHRRLGDVDKRLCYRIQHHYTNVQSSPWQPYFQQPFINDYVDQMSDRAKVLRLDNFKIPEKEKQNA